MATTYPITIAVDNIRTARFIPVATVAGFTSPFTGQRQMFSYPNQHWRVDMNISAMNRTEGEALVGQLLSLNGSFGTFYLGDPLYTTPKGIATGTPLLNGASQTGNTIITDGWTASQTGIVKAGDWLQVGTGSTRQLVKVTADANSDGGGNSTIEIWPRIRTAFGNNTSIITSSPTGVFALTSSDSGAWEIDSDSLIKGVSISAYEAF